MKKLLLSAGLSIFAGFIIVGCGGGGDEGDVSVPSDSTDGAIITAENTEVVVATVAGVIGSGMEGIEESQNVSGDMTQPILKVLEQPSFKALLQNKSEILAESTGAIECPDGGTMSMDVGETQTVMTVTYDACSMAGTYMDGTMVMEISEDQTSMFMTMTDFTIKEGTWTSYTTYTKVTVEGVDSNGNFTNAIFYERSGYDIEDGDRTDVKEFTLTFWQGAVGEFIFTVDGMVKNDCLGDWVTVSTEQDLKIMETAECPHEGALRIEGEGSNILVIFNSNGAQVDTFKDVDGSIEGILNQQMSCSELHAATCAN